MKYFVDTSALAKLYVEERGTPDMIELASSVAPLALVVSSLARIEFRSLVRRRERSGSIRRAQAADVLEQFDQHWATVFLVQPTSDFVQARALDIIDRHGLRTCDSIQLAAFEVARESDPDCSTFICADHALLKAVSADGVLGLNPEMGPVL
ncbi:MAG: hypothetical protein CHACPFDD_00447 [Phycisphaerae bacterium]|nr:hypothetical protein [Phycisphaerae bacterium]